jgi:hypothetical protein
MSLLVILGTRTFLGEKDFAEWGWRVPFLLSFVLLGVSVWIRLSLNESPLFKKMKAEGKTSKAPLKESFGEWKNLKIVILALVGLTAGQAVVWYTGQFYALFFLTQTLKVDSASANILIAISLAIGTPFFILLRVALGQGRPQAHHHGGLPHRRAHLLPALQGPHALRQPAAREGDRDGAGDRHRGSGRVLVPVQPGGHLEVHVVVRHRQELPRAQFGGVPPTSRAPVGSIASVKIGDQEIASFDGRNSVNGEFKARSDAFNKKMTDSIRAAGYPAKADPEQVNKPAVVAILTLLVIYVTMVYGPIAAMLVELFPTRIRYTSMSLPYHIGNGWFGGFLPTTAFAMVAATGDIYHGLWYPIVVALATFVIGTLFIRETKDRRIAD